MNRKGWLSAAVLMALGAGHQAVTPVPSSGKQTQPASPSPPAQSEPLDLCNALRAHFSVPLIETAGSGPCLDVNRNILFIIATTPSPTNSQLALSFDRTVESIQRAAGDRGFLFDRFVFPWDAEPHRQTDPDKKRLEEKRRRDSEAKPGLLLFRSHFKEVDPLHQYESLGVLLVPENPSSGVNSTAFLAAAEFARANTTRTDPLPVLGPSFSSSAVSLHTVIDYGGRPYWIRSGSATVPEAWRLLNSHGVHPFYATVRDDDQANEALSKHLDITGEWQKEGRIAILSESGTLFGAHAAVSNKESERANKKLERVNKESKRLNLVFPRGISWLRNAYQDMPASAGPPALPAGIPAPVAKLLPFAISEPAYGDDKPPSLSATQTPISQEAALISIANTLRHERIRFVVLTSTDPLDNIFLIRFLRAHCPDLRIITFESDLLYVRAASEFPATGVVLVTTYPLFTRNQEWTSYGESEDRVPFVSMASEGTYNALRSLLLEAAGCHPEGGDRPLDYGTPFQAGSHVPPVWLTVTTPAGYWPLAVIGDGSAGQDSALKPSIGSSRLLSWPHQGPENEPDVAEGRPSPGTLNRLWYSLAIGFLAVSSIPLLALAGRLNCTNFPVVCSFAFRPNHDHNALGRAFFRSVVLLSFALLILVVLAWPALVLIPYGLGTTALIVDVVLTLTAIALLAASAIDIARTRPKVALRYAPRYAAMIAVAFLLTAFWIAMWWLTFEGGPHHEGFFAAYRSVDLVNGVAPTVPFGFLLLALLSWAWVQLKRLHMFHDSPHSVPALGPRFLGEDRWARLQAQIDHVNDSVENPFSLPASAFVAIISAVVAVFLIMREYTQGLELRSFDIAFDAAFSLVVLLLGLTSTRFVLIWTRLRRVLRGLEMHPIRDVFSMVPLVDEWGPILHRGIEGDRLERLQRELVFGPGCAANGEITDTTLQEVREGLLDPGWVTGKCEGASFQSAAKVFALPYLLFIQATCRQMENLLVFLTAGFVLTLISLNSYPFQSEHVLSWFMANVLILIGLAVTFVLAGSERDPILSRMNGTAPGKIGKDFYMNLLSYGALPVLTVLAAQFPAIGSFLFSWVQPLLQALRG